MIVTNYVEIMDAETPHGTYILLRDVESNEYVIAKGPKGQREQVERHSTRIQGETRFMECVEGRE